MLDLQSFLLYELYMSRRQELATQEQKRRRPVEGPTMVARVLGAVGDGLVASGSMLKRRYRPMPSRRVQTSS